ncbi:MAG: DegV family protein [Atopobiaceae bacterium]|jgi:DegV family protein with EDD domain|nr:DegV family protein [Atopobiaceae bacterium]MCI2172593.1 DegV family protein [Atopobiaceae bacterium]MCI2206900.1 DegV family protein [Atopobiaceae bacterium]
MAIRIITDSASDILPHEIEGVTVLPLSITFGTTTYLDGVELTHERFYEMLVEGDDLPKTSQVTPYQFEQALEECRDAGDEALVITVAADLSGTNQSAEAAMSQVDVTCRLVDSGSASIGERILVELAARMVDGGSTLDEVADALESQRHDIRVLACLDTLEYLRRGGRISAAAGMVGSVLSIKPVVSISEGAVGVLGKARGSKNARNLLSQEVEKAGGIDFSLPYAVGYSGTAERMLAKYVDDSRHLWEKGTDEVPSYSVGSTIGTHVGPGAIGVAFFGRKDA